MARAGSERGRDGDWTFLTNHAHVLLALNRDPQCRLRDVAALVGITERSVQAIVADLEAEGYLTRIRVQRPPPRVGNFWLNRSRPPCATRATKLPTRADQRETSYAPDVRLSATSHSRSSRARSYETGDEETTRPSST